MKPNDREKFKLRRAVSEKTLRHEELTASDEYDELRDIADYWSNRTYQIGRFSRILGNLGIKEAAILSDKLYW